MWIVRRQKHEVILVHCIGGRLPICGHELIKNIMEGHCRIPCYGWWVTWWYDLERIIDMHVESVIGCVIDVFPCFEVVFNHGKFCVGG